MMVDDLALCAALRRRACLDAIAVQRAELREIRRERRRAHRRIPLSNRVEVQRIFGAVLGAVAAVGWMLILVRFSDALVSLL